MEALENDVVSDAAYPSKRQSISNMINHQNFAIFLNKLVMMFPKQIWTFKLFVCEKMWPRNFSDLGRPFYGNTKQWLYNIFDLHPFKDIGMQIPRLNDKAEIRRRDY